MYGFRNSHLAYPASANGPLSGEISGHLQLRSFQNRYDRQFVISPPIISRGGEVEREFAPLMEVRPPQRVVQPGMAYQQPLPVLPLQYPGTQRGLCDTSYQHPQPVLPLQHSDIQQGDAVALNLTSSMGPWCHEIPFYSLQHERLSLPSSPVSAFSSAQGVLPFQQISPARLRLASSLSQDSVDSQDSLLSQNSSHAVTPSPLVASILTTGAAASSGQVSAFATALAADYCSASEKHVTKYMPISLLHMQTNTKKKKRRSPAPQAANEGVEDEKGEKAPLPQNLRGDPFRSAKVKTELCRNYSTAKGCPFGDKCNYAHGEHELKYTQLMDLERAGLVDIEVFRTRPCPTWVATGAW